jgi:shikimate kinase
MTAESLGPEQHGAPHPMNIVLVGYRATGKSTVAGRLAEALGRRVVSTDAEVERREGRVISQIIAESGWDYFRDRESEVCQEISLMEDVIIDTGGGAILRPGNREALRRNAIIILFTASNETIAKRIEQNDSRPSLTGAKSAVNEVAEVMRIRGPIYDDIKDHVVDTDQLGVEESLEAVLAILSRE